MEIKEEPVNDKIKDTLPVKDENAESKQVKDVEEKKPNVIKRFFHSITVEPILWCYCIPSAISAIAVAQLYLEKACRAGFDYSDEICDGLLIHHFQNLSHYEEETQKLVAEVNAWKLPLSTFLPALIILFVGSWSDRRGLRKPCMLIPIIGEFISTMWLLLSTYSMKDISIQITGLLEGLFTSFSGGLSVLLMGIFSYLGDITSEEDRTLRIGVASISVTVGFLIGGAVSGYLFEQLGYFGIFGLSAVLYAVGILYGQFCVKESEIKVEHRKINFCVDFFDPRHVLETIRVCLKRRPEYGRLKIFLSLAVFLIALGPGLGE